MGITRIASVTGLDRIGIPVAIAVRPNSRSISVAQGKGQTKQFALASAAMEAIETWHAEDLAARIRVATSRELGAAVGPATLCCTNRPLSDDTPIPWIAATPLRGPSPYPLLQTSSPLPLGEGVGGGVTHSPPSFPSPPAARERQGEGGTRYLPAELIHTDYTIPPMPGSGYFLTSTNGLASGNTMDEAISAALCEVIERDAIALWHARTPQQRAASHVDLASVEDPGCRTLLDRYAAAGIAVRAWNITSDIGVSAFLCWIREADARHATLRQTFAGAGCHPDPAIALSRALTEAAQTRLNVIVGTRDDLPTQYVARAAAMVGPVVMDVFAAEFPAHRLADIAGFRAEDPAGDVAWTLAGLRGAGIATPLMVDLTRAEIGVPVVRVVVRGLEGDCHHSSYVPGKRARTMETGA